MTRNKLSDQPAIKSFKEAEETLAEMANIERKVEGYKARRDARERAAKEDYATLAAGLFRQRDILAAQLGEFTETELADAERKTHVCAAGEFGLRKSTRIEIEDPDTCIAALKDLRLKACVRVKESLDVKAMGKLHDDTLAEVGAERVTEDVFFWKTGASKKGGK